MPSSPLKPCSYPGCSALVKRGRCDRHRAVQVGVYVKDPERKALYDSARWQRIRHDQLVREPWCAMCLKKGWYVVATDVDHVIAHEGDPVKFYQGELQSLCKRCHSRKTAREVRERMGRGVKKSRLGGNRPQGASDVKNIPNVENPE